MLCLESVRSDLDNKRNSEYSEIKSSSSELRSKFDCLTSLSYSWSQWSLELAQYESGRSLKSQGTFVEILLSMNFSINYNLDGVPEIFHNILKPNSHHYRRISTRLGAINFQQFKIRGTQNLEYGKEISKALNIMREEIPNFYTKWLPEKDFDWYLGPFFSTQHVEGYLLGGLVKGWLEFKILSDNYFQFNHEDIHEKNLKKLILLFLWIVEQYWEMKSKSLDDFPYYNENIAKVINSEGLLLIDAYNQLYHKDFANKEEILRLTQQFERIRLNAKYPS